MKIKFNDRVLDCERFKEDVIISACGHVHSCPEFSDNDSDLLVCNPDCPFSSENVPDKYKGDISRKLFLEYVASLEVKE